MNTPTLRLRTLSTLLFSLGSVSIFLLGAGMTWAHIEAEFYGFPNLGREKLPSLNCPYILSASETGAGAAIFNNPTNRELHATTRIDFSGLLTNRSERQVLKFAPRETRRVPFTVSEADRDLGFFIFVRAYMYPAYGVRTRQATCGIFMFNLPLVTGGLLFGFMFGGGLMGLIAGLYLWDKANRPMNDLLASIQNAMRFLAIIELLALFLSLRGAWLPASPLLVISILTPLAFLYIKK